MEGEGPAGSLILERAFSFFCVNFLNLGLQNLRLSCIIIMYRVINFSMVRKDVLQCKKVSNGP